MLNILDSVISVVNHLWSERSVSSDRRKYQKFQSSRDGDPAWYQARRHGAGTGVYLLKITKYCWTLWALVKGVSGGSRTPKIIEKIPEGTKLCPKHDIPVPPPKRTLADYLKLCKRNSFLHALHFSVPHMISKQEL